MDLYCQRCDEPWDVCYIGSDMDVEYPEVSDDGRTMSDRFKAGEGCPACDWGNKAPKKQSLRGEAMGMMMDLLGDDIDGAASMMEDFEDEFEDFE
jgi:hypothetical protein